MDQREGKNDSQRAKRGKKLQKIRKKMDKAKISPRATVPIRKGFPIWRKSLLLWRPTSDPTANVTATWDDVHTRHMQTDSQTDRQAHKDFISTREADMHSHQDESNFTNELFNTETWAENVYTHTHTLTLL